MSKGRKSYEEKQALEKLEEELGIQEMTAKERRAYKKENKQKKREKKDRNRQFAFVTYSFVAVFLCLIGYLVYFNVVRADEVVRSPYNARQDNYAKYITRGTIYDRNMEVLAETVKAEDGSEARVYPYGDLYSHVVGYNVHGKAGLESTLNFDLLTSNAFILDKIKADFADEKQPGDSAVTTLDTSLQQAAYNALGSFNGAVVAIEPSTGKILAWVSKPSFDPNQVSAQWEGLNSDENSVLINRVSNGSYAPGSTFKLVTTLEYMRENPDTYGNYTYDCSGVIDYNGVSIACYNNTAHGHEDLGNSVAYSCNTSFSNIGLSLNQDRFQKTAEELLFEKKLPGGFGNTVSHTGITAAASDGDKMMTAMGQGKVQVSPYHMALITAAIANGGELMTPYLLDYTQNNGGSVVEKKMPKSYGALMTAAEASQLKEYMKQVVDYGTASNLGRGGYDVAGKTGTAEYSDEMEKNHSWFVGFSNMDNPDLVVSVVIEKSDGAGRATDVAGAVFDQYYNQ
nr:penicillin-binding transpeptidase domain-containing protein [Ohessyouella blattaphilus]